MERIFMLHPGLSWSITPYWELVDDDEPFAGLVRAGEIRKAGTIITFPVLPAAWMPGRFLATIHDEVFDAAQRLGQPGAAWVEVTGQVEVDLARGLAACPEWLRERYRGIAEAARLDDIHSAMAEDISRRPAPRAEKPRLDEIEMRHAGREHLYRERRSPKMQDEFVMRKAKK